VKPAATIRSYLSSDWEQVCTVHDQARVQELSRGSVDPRAFRPMAEVAERDEFFVSETLVACIGVSVIGFVSWHDAYISWLYVSPANQRRGVGGLLLDAALRHIGPQAWTNMVGGNEPALALYRAAGLEVVWTRPTDCDGFPCSGVRLALPTSCMRDPSANRRP